MNKGELSACFESVLFRTLFLDHPLGSKSHAALV